MILEINYMFYRWFNIWRSSSSAFLSVFKLYYFDILLYKWCLHFLLFPIENNTICWGSSKAYFRLPLKNF